MNKPEWDTVISIEMKNTTKMKHNKQAKNEINEPTTARHWPRDGKGTANINNTTSEEKKKDTISKRLLT